MFGATGIAVLAILAVSGCVPTPADPPSATSTPAATSTESATPAPAPTEAAPPPEEQPTGQSAADGFRAWLAVSRAPDAAAACAGLAPELATRMVDEMNATGPIPVESCEQMISTTAELYRATGQSTDVDIAVEQETESAATLFVTYLSSGDCGTVVMELTGTEWILTDQSKGCAG